MPCALVETPLAMAARHVAEGRERVAKQELLVSEMTRNGHTTILTEAHRLLAAMRASQKLAEGDLSRERAEADAKVPTDPVPVLSRWGDR